MAAKKSRKKAKKTPPSKAERPKKAEYPKKAEQEAALKAEPENGSAGLIKTIIIAATFISIGVLSVFAQGLDGTWPGMGVVAVRFVLLSFFSLVYFGMLYFTKLSRRNDAQKPQPGKK